MNNVSLVVLVEDSVGSGCEKKLKAIHGLSILVNTDKPRTSILMDTGQSGSVLLNNMNVLQTRPKRIDALVISHGHYDHTGGLPAVLKKAKDIPIIAHPETFNPKFKISPRMKNIGSPIGASALKSQSCMILTRNSVQIAEGILTTGEISRYTSYERVEGFWTIDRERFVEDTMRDEIALVLNLEDKGLVIISGCAHAGIVNTIRQGQRLTKTQKIHAIIGGFHLKDSNDETIEATIEDLVRMDPDFLCPCHCTGKKMINNLISVFQRKCVPLKTGDSIDL